MIRCSSFAEKAMADEVLHGFGFLGHKGGKDGGDLQKRKSMIARFPRCHRRYMCCHGKKNVGGARVWADFVCFLRDFAECG